MPNQLPVIVMDVDGVIYDWDQMARNLLQVQFELPPIPESTHWQSIQEHVTSEQWEWLWHEGIIQGLFRWGPAYQQEAEAIKELCNYSNLIFCTKTPFLARKDRIHWLSLHNFQAKGLIMLDPWESKAAVPGDIMVDDNPDFITEWKQGNPNKSAFLLTRPWNKHFTCTNFMRAYNLQFLIDWCKNYASIPPALDVGEEGLALAT